MADKKVRIRKAETTKEQADATHLAESSKLTGIKTKLLKASIFRIFRVVLRPFHWLVPSYFVNSWRELRKVTWPNRHETRRLTLAVFIFAVVFGALIAGVDKSLDLIFKKVILKQ
ncbi:MAG: preprotein translocase subunit SecE [bacterium]|nr:preprotein translocase subunit SecE [bacterium]